MQTLHFKERKLTICLRGFDTRNVSMYKERMYLKLMVKWQQSIGIGLSFLHHLLFHYVYSEIRQRVGQLKFENNCITNNLQLQLKPNKCHDITRYKTTDPTGEKKHDWILILGQKLNMLYHSDNKNYSDKSKSTNIGIINYYVKPGMKSQFIEIVLRHVFQLLNCIRTISNIFTDLA